MPTSGHRGLEVSELAQTSHEFTYARFCTRSAAQKYPNAYRNHGRDARERGAIVQLLRNAPAGAHVLDLPCGTGRVSRLLVDRGLRVTAADASGEMVAAAQANLSEYIRTKRYETAKIEFATADVMRTGFAADAFDAVICNRLFHHFTEPQTRTAALRELARVCRGSIIVSFFNSFSLSAILKGMSQHLRNEKPVDRVPISLRTFTRDIVDAGLRVEAQAYVHWPVSPQCYLVLRKPHVA